MKFNKKTLTEELGKFKSDKKTFTKNAKQKIVMTEKQLDRLLNIMTEDSDWQKSLHYNKNQSKLRGVINKTINESERELNEIAPLVYAAGLLGFTALNCLIGAAIYGGYGPCICESAGGTGQGDDGCSDSVIPPGTTTTDITPSAAMKLISACNGSSKCRALNERDIAAGNIAIAPKGYTDDDTKSTRKLPKNFEDIPGHGKPGQKQMGGDESCKDMTCPEGTECKNGVCIDGIGMSKTRGRMYNESRLLKTTKTINESEINKMKNMFNRLSTTGRNYNPARD
jgi:hypothetical protein